MRTPRFSALFGTLVLATWMTVSGCDVPGGYKAKATGPNGEIVVVIDTTHWKGPLGDVLRAELAPYQATLPAPEPLFDLRNSTLPNDRALEDVRGRKNVVFAAPLSDDTPEARFVRARLDSAAIERVEAGQVAVISRSDLWRQSQQVFYVVGSTAGDVARALVENGDQIRYAFQSITRQRMHEDMFEKGRQPEIEQQLLDGHGFRVDVQHDYRVAMDTTNFVWLRRIVTPDSWRSLFVWYTDEASPADLSPEWILEARNRLTRAYVNGNLGAYVSVDERRPLESENINFLDRFGFEVRGLWHMISDAPDGTQVAAGMGGPFVTYGFYDQASGRTYIIDGMVFAPGFEKREFLRQMEVIAYSFRTQAEVEASAAPTP